MKAWRHDLKDLPEVATLGRRLWVSWVWLVQVTVGSEREWPMLVGACRRDFAREGTFTSGREGSGWDEGGSRLNSAEPAVTPPGLDSDLGMWRPLARVTESGRGKVPIPLSRVLIWQPEPKGTGRGVWCPGEAGETDDGKERGALVHMQWKGLRANRASVEGSVTHREGEKDLEL